MSFIIAVCLIAFGRIFGSIALKNLPEKQQATIKSVFSKIRAYVIAPFLIFILTVFWARSFLKANTIFTASVIGAYLIYLICVHFITLRKLVEHNIPEGYKTRFHISYYASQAGVIVLLVGYLM